MTKTTASVLFWSPRIAGLAVCLFIGMFAVDAFTEGKSFVRALPDFFIHLVPALVLLAVVIAASRWPAIGAVIFIGMAVFYAVAMSNGRLDWILTISGPLLLVGVLFLWSWLVADRRLA